MGLGGDGECSSFSLMLRSRDPSLAKLDCSDIESDMTTPLNRIKVEEKRDR